MKWYALFVETGKEIIIQEMLNRNFAKEDMLCLVPLRVVPEKQKGITLNVNKTLFPGYVFIKVSMNAEFYYAIKNTPKIYRILRSGKHNEGDIETYFTSIDEREMDFIIQLTGENGIISFSKAFLTGDRIVVSNGPLKGLERVIKKIDKRKKRAKILLNFLGDEQQVDVGLIIE